MVAKDPRQYVRIAVDLPANRKLAGADPRVKWLHVTGICWSGQNLTDGQVTPSVITAIAGVPPKLARELMNRDLWHEKGHACPECPQPVVRGDVVIHDYEQHQDSADVVRRNRDEKARAGRLGNHAKWGHGGPFEECPKCNE